MYKVDYSGQNLAVKIFKENEMSNAWKRELNSLTVLTHTNIVRIHNIVYENLDDRAQLRCPLGYAMELMARSAADQFQSSPGLPKLVFFSPTLYTGVTCDHPFCFRVSGSVERANAASLRRPR